MPSIEIKVLDGGVQRKLRALRRALGPDNLRPYLERIGRVLVEEYRANLREGGARSPGGPWPPVSWVTLALRRSYGGPRLESIGAAKAAAATAAPLRDTGALESSLGFAIQDTAVRVSVGVPYAGKLHFGGPEVFLFDRAAEARLARNVPPTLPGPAPRRPTKTGRRRRSRPAKANWNPEFFKIKAILRKKSGQGVDVPARPILYDPPVQVMDQVTAIIAEAVEAALKKE